MWCTPRLREVFLVHTFLRMSYSSTPFSESIGCCESISITCACALHMFTVVICPRRVAHTFSFSCMRRQQTLGTSLFTNAISLYFTRLRLAKFFAMPPGKKAPPQQSSLTELWASKPKKQNNPATSTTATSGGYPRLRPKPDGHGSTADAAGPTIPSEERAYRHPPLRADANRAERKILFLFCSRRDFKA
jgi:hypothetical protein